MVCLKNQGRLCVPRVDGLQERIMQEAYSSKYSNNLGCTKMYLNLRLLYCLKGKKKDTNDFQVPELPACEIETQQD